MTKLASSRLRADGKASFDAIYDEPTPAAYFSALWPLEYMTPGCAQPLVRRCVEALRRRLKLETVTVLDLCAGYGVNAALLRHRLTLPDLYRRPVPAPPVPSASSPTRCGSYADAAEMQASAWSRRT